MRALQAAGFKAYVSTWGWDNTSDDEEQQQDCWVIKRDGSVRPDRDDPDIRFYNFRDVEVVSPVLLNIPESHQAVREVTKILTNSFRVSVNSSCGLHVHVGDGTKGFPMSTLRHLAACIWAFDPQISTIHEWHRFAGDASWCGPIRKYDTNELVLKMVKSILAVNNLYELCGIVQADRCKSHAYNWLNMENNEKKVTLEFRQHAGTLDENRIIAVRICPLFMLFLSIFNFKRLLII
jgi:hypothetical protein